VKSVCVIIERCYPGNSNIAVYEKVKAVALDSAIAEKRIRGYIDDLFRYFRSIGGKATDITEDDGDIAIEIEYPMLQNITVFKYCWTIEKCNFAES